MRLAPGIGRPTDGDYLPAFATLLEETIDMSQESGSAGIVGIARRFGEEVVVPVAVELDARPDPEDSFSWEIVEAASAAGLRTATFAQKYNGPVSTVSRPRKSWRSWEGPTSGCRWSSPRP